MTLETNQASRDPAQAPQLARPHSRGPSVPPIDSIYPGQQMDGGMSQRSSSTLMLPLPPLGHSFADPSSSNPGTQRMAIALPLPFPQQPAPGSAYTGYSPYTPFDYSQYSRYTPLEPRQAAPNNSNNFSSSRIAFPEPSPQPLEPRPRLQPEYRSMASASAYTSVHHEAIPYSAMGHEEPPISQNTVQEQSIVYQPLYAVAPPPFALPPAPVTNLAFRRTSVPAAHFASECECRPLIESGGFKLMPKSVITPTLSPASADPHDPPSRKPSTPRLHFQTNTPTVPFRLSAKDASPATCPVNPLWKKYHALQKRLLSTLHIKDDPIACLDLLHECVRAEAREFGEEDSDSDPESDAETLATATAVKKGITMSQLVNLPLLDTTETLLHMAVKWCKPNVVKALLSVGANARLRSGFTCAQFPCPKKRKGTAGSPSRVNSRSAAASPPPEPEYTNSGRITRKRKVNYSEDALANKQLTVQQQQQKDRKDDQDSCAEVACCSGCFRIVCDEGVVNNSGIEPFLTPLHIMALWPGGWVGAEPYLFRDILQGLWGALLDRDLSGRTFLHLAITRAKNASSDDHAMSHASGIMDCLIQGVESLDSELTTQKQRLSCLLDASDCDGNTALHGACSAGDLECVKVLVRSQLKDSTLVSATVGLLNSESLNALDIVVSAAQSVVQVLAFKEEELACLKGVAYSDDARIFRRALAGTFLSAPVALTDVIAEEELKFRMRKLVLLEGIEGESLQKLVKLREIASCLIHTLEDIVDKDEASDEMFFSRLTRG
ncbi:hypothetical protein HDU98_005396 [Podochytrium sp. JEL0797]|nr:hypothetical protein HDU98_005396 [Podochytrium sp. JEL0797]